MGDKLDMEPVLIDKVLYDRLRALRQAKMATTTIPTLKVPTLLEMTSQALLAYLEREEGKS